MWFIVFSPYGTDFGILDGDNFHREEQVGNNLRGNYERFLKVNLSLMIGFLMTETLVVELS